MFSFRLYTDGICWRDFYIPMVYVFFSFIYRWYMLTWILYTDSICWNIIYIPMVYRPCTDGISPIYRWYIAHIPIFNRTARFLCWANATRRWLFPPSFSPETQKTVKSLPALADFGEEKNGFWIICTKFVPAKLLGAVARHRGYIEYSYSILMVLHLKKCPTNITVNQKKVSTPLIGVPLPFISL